jgi:putative DNA primase/helicase
MYHRNDSCHEYAFHRWTKDCVSVEQLIADVYAFNQEHCDPPLDESELDRTVIPSVQKFRQNGPVLVGGVPVGSAPAAQTAQPVVWGEPGVIENPLLPVLPFLPEFLPACVRPWAVDVAQRMSVPLDFTGICLLITLAGVVNRRAFVYPKKNDKEWKEALSISGAVVADSGKLKTPTWNVFTNVLVEIELNWKRTNKKLQDQYKADMKAWREGEKARKERVKKGATEEPLPEPVKPPPCRSLIENDMTPEVFHSSMSENPAGLFVFRDELAGWVAELDKEGREQEQEIFLGAMNGNDARKCKRIGRGEVFAIMSASLFGGFQPDLLREFLNKAQKKHDGLIQRFGALVYPDPVLFHRMDRAADTKMKDAFVLLVRKLSWMDAEAISFHFDSTAQERFDKWYDAHDIKTARETSMLKQSHLAKYRGLLPKFAALLQLADVVTELPEHSTVIGPHYIDLEHLEQAIGLLTYLESHMHRIYGCVRNEAQVAEEVVAEHIKSGALRDGFTTRDIRRKCWKGLQNNDTIYGALEYLEEVSWVRRSSQQLGAGRKTDRWEINPAVTERRNEK